MKPRSIFSILKRPIALLLALFMLFALTGCSEQEISDALDIAGQLLEAEMITDAESSAEEVTVSEQTDIPPPIEETTAAEETTAIEEATAAEETEAETTAVPETEQSPIDEYGYYYSRDEVALYLYTYGRLPSNFITKSDAEDLGWSGGSVERYLEGAAIGGDKFSNREGLLPKKNGRVYRECDIDTDGAPSRGAKRIVYSNDGLIYYTDDHYESFTLLYGEE